MELKTLLSDFAEALRKVIEHLAFGVPEFSSASSAAAMNGPGPHM